MWADHVAAPDFGGLETERLPDQVHHSLHGEGGFRPPGAPVGRIRHLVGRHDSPLCREILDLVGAKQMNGRVVGDDSAQRVPGSAIDKKFVAKRKDMAVTVEADLDIVPLVA
jgi:hypothetical protein